MFFKKYKVYHIISLDKAKKLVKENVLEPYELINGRSGYQNQNHNSSYLLDEMLCKTFIANDNGDVLNNYQTLDDLEGNYSIFPWMCAEYYNRKVMETE